MTETDNNVLDISKAGLRAHPAFRDGELWPFVCKTAIIPALRTGERFLSDQGIKSALYITERPRQHVILVWEPKGQLLGSRLGLHLTYHGQGRISFDLSVRRDRDGHQYQGSYYQEQFGADEHDLPSQIIRRVGTGLGLAKAYEEAPPSIRWVTKSVPSHRLN